MILHDLEEELFELGVRVGHPDFSFGGDFHQREWEVRLVVAWKLVESRVRRNLQVWLERSKSLARLARVGNDCVVDVVHGGE